MRKEIKKYPRKKVDLPFESVEKRARFEAFLKKTGRKAGPYLLNLAEEAMAKESC